MSESDGCAHYQRHCKVLAECCNEWVSCRLCHDDKHPDHNMDRHAVKQMKCSLCGHEQPPAKSCSECKGCMGEYFCGICNLFDDKGVEKQNFHCDQCGICRVGGQDNFFHCEKCCGCYPISIKGNHTCIEGSMHRECAICLEVTFSSIEQAHVLPCGHVLHVQCWKEYTMHGHDRCPSCRAQMFWPESLVDELESGQERNSDAESDETIEEYEVEVEGDGDVDIDVDAMAESSNFTDSNASFQATEELMERGYRRNRERQQAEQGEGDPLRILRVPRSSYAYDTMFPNGRSS